MKGFFDANSLKTFSVSFLKESSDLESVPKISSEELLERVLSENKKYFKTNQASTSLNIPTGFDLEPDNLTKKSFSFLSPLYYKLRKRKHFLFEKDEYTGSDRSALNSDFFDIISFSSGANQDLYVDKKNLSLNNSILSGLTVSPQGDNSFSFYENSDDRASSSEELINSLISFYSSLESLGTENPLKNFSPIEEIQSPSGNKIRFMNTRGEEKIISSEQYRELPNHYKLLFLSLLSVTEANGPTISSYYSKLFKNVKENRSLNEYFYTLGAICKLEYLFGFEIDKTGIPILSAPIFKELNTESIKLMRGRTVLCRLVPYSNEKIGIENKIISDFSIIDRYSMVEVSSNFDIISEDLRNAVSSLFGEIDPSTGQVLPPFAEPAQPTGDGTTDGTTGATTAPGTTDGTTGDDTGDDTGDGTDGITGDDTDGTTAGSTGDPSGDTEEQVACSLLEEDSDVSAVSTDPSAWSSSLQGVNN